MNPDFWKGRKVLLTGHTGFKGAWLSEWLLGLGAELTGFALAPPTVPSLFSLLNLDRRMHSVMGDVRDPTGIWEIVNQTRPEVVIHMAAQSLVLDSYEDPVNTFATNVMGTVHVLDAVRRQGSVRAVVNVTSDKCYENREWVWGYREDEPMGGHDPYSASKGAAELVGQSYRRAFLASTGVRVASARAGNVVGGGDWADNRLVPDMMRGLLDNKPVLIRNPAAIRPWQHVLEPLAGYLELAEALYDERGDEFAEGWNFGPYEHETQPVRWIADRLCSAWGQGASWVAGESAAETLHEAGYLKLDCSKARSRLGWKPRLDLAETLNWIVDWYRAYQDGADVIATTGDQIARYLSRLE